VIDDLFGRTDPTGRNEDRARLCAQYLLEDVTGDQAGSPGRVRNPIARAVFCRGQLPARSIIGDVVENDLATVLRLVREGWLEAPPGKPAWALVLLDLCFYTGPVTKVSNRRAPGMPEGRPDDDSPDSYFGLTVLRALREVFPDLPVVIFSSKAREEVSAQFSYHGGLGFLDRASPDGARQLADFLRRHGLVPDETGELEGASLPLLFALRAARRVASARTNVLIRGERGVGKELLARYIHRHGPDPGSPFLVVDSGVLSPQLYASELFGYVRGAFTGADQTRRGKITLASGGDMFLDEIGNVAPEVQAGLLRVLEDRRVVPLGATASETLDVRFISATNEDIEGRAAVGSFRSDLLDRLRQGGSIFLPPLRTRMGDLPLLMERFLRDAERATPGALHREIHPDCLELLGRHDWPGNIRELRDCILKAVASHPDVEHLVPLHLQIPATVNSSPIAPPTPTVDTPARLAHELDSFPFEGVPTESLNGGFDILQSACSRALARYLRASLAATRRPTPANPSGQIYIHPAVKLMSGNPSLSAMQASDWVKRILRAPGVKDTALTEDALLREALETAMRLRPTGRRLKR
jgi:DNA-binding NtrC family response regulator